MTSKVKKIGIPLLVIFFIILLFAAGYTITQQAAISGGSTVSVSNIDYNSNDPELAGKYWTVYVSQDGTGGSLYGTVSSAKMIDASDGVQANSFTISYDLIENKANYKINRIDAGGTFYRYQVITRGQGTSGCDQRLPSSSYEFVSDVNLGGTTIGACVYRTIEGQAGLVANIGQSFKTRINVNTGGVVSSAILDSASSNDVSIGSIGRARFVGSLSNLKVLPVASDYDVCAAFKNSWDTVSCNARTSIYQPLLTDFINCAARAGSVGVVLIDTSTEVQKKKNAIDSGCTNSLNNALNNALSHKDFEINVAQPDTTEAGQDVTFTTNGIPSVVSGTSASGIITFDLGSTQFHYPQIRLKLSAASVGTYEPIAKPQITCSASTNFQSGGFGYVNVDVKNIGTTQGSIDVAAVCNAPFASTDKDRVSLNVGETSRVSLVVSGDVNQNSAGSCTITASASTKSELKSTCVASISATAAVVKCTEGNKRLAGRSIIQQCISNSWVSIQTCEVGEEANSDFKCVAEGGGGGGGGGDCSPILGLQGKSIIPNLSFSCLGFSGSFKIVLAFILGLLTFAVLGTLIPKFEDNRVKMMVLIGSIVASVLVGYLVYAYVLFGIVLAIILLISRGILGAFIGQVRSIGKGE